MNSFDLRTLSTALAFVTVVTHGQTITLTDETERSLALAQQIRDFCDLHVSKATPFQTIDLTDEPDAANIDLSIHGHVWELRHRKETALPQDRATLLRFYDRLQLRKVRRTQRDFYATVTEGKLAELVRVYIDEEIDATEGLS